MNPQKKRYAICIDNTGYEASLIPRKLYEVLPDERAASDDFLRVIDESGEDYLFHRRHFLIIELPIEDEDELESLILAYSPKFQEILRVAEQQIQDGSGIPHDEFWK